MREGGAGLAGGVDRDLVERGRDPLVGVVDVDVLGGDLADPAGRASAVEPDPEVEAVAAALGAEHVVVAHGLVRGHPDVHLVLVGLTGLQRARQPDDVAGPVTRQFLGPEQRAAAGHVGLEAESALTRFPGRVEDDRDLGQVVPGGDDAPALERLRGVAVEHEHGAEVIDVPAVVVGVGKAAAALELGRDLLGEQPLRLVDPALGGPVTAGELGVGQPPLPLRVGGHPAGVLVQRQGRENRRPHLVGQPSGQRAELPAELIVGRARVAAGQLEQHRADLLGHVAGERAVLAERLKLRRNLRQAGPTARPRGRCH